jgi:hypothetical protein
VIEERGGPRWAWLLVIIAAIVGVIGGWWLYGLVTTA